MAFGNEVLVERSPIVSPQLCEAWGFFLVVGIWHLVSSMDHSTWPICGFDWGVRNLVDASLRIRLWLVRWKCAQFMIIARIGYSCAVPTSQFGDIVLCFSGTIED